MSTLAAKDASGATVNLKGAGAGTSGDPFVSSVNLDAPAPVGGTLTNHSGSITAGGASQQIVGADAARRFLFFQNQSPNNMWLKFGGAAAQDNTSAKVGPGESYTFTEHFVSTQSVNVIGTNTGDLFCCDTG